MEPRRLLDEGATEIEKTLLRAGREDGPCEAAAWETLAAIQAAPLLPPAGGGVESAAAGGATAASAKALTLATWAKVGLLAAGLVGGAAVTHHYTRSHETSEIPSPVLQPRTMPVPAEVPPPAVIEKQHQLPRSTGLREGRARVSRPVREPARKLSASPIDRSLGLETDALDRAREALDGHRFAEALRLIGEYEAAYPQGRLRPEATILRLAALVHGGRHAEARSLARRLLADSGYRTYESRVLSLLRKMEK